MDRFNCLIVWRIRIKNNIIKDFSKAVNFLLRYKPYICKLIQTTLL